MTILGPRRQERITKRNTTNAVRPLNIFVSCVGGYIFVCYLVFGRRFALMYSRGIIRRNPGAKYNSLPNFHRSTTNLFNSEPNDGCRDPSNMQMANPQVRFSDNNVPTRIVEFG